VQLPALAWHWPFTQTPLQSASAVHVFRAQAIEAHSKLSGQSALVEHTSGKQRWPGEQYSQALHSASDMHPVMHSDAPQLHFGGSHLVVGSCIAHSVSVVQGVGGS